MPILICIVALSFGLDINCLWDLQRSTPKMLGKCQMSDCYAQLVLLVVLFLRLLQLAQIKIVIYFMPGWSVLDCLVL